MTPLRYITKLALSAVWLLPLQPSACTDSTLPANHISVAAPYYPTFSEPEGKGVFFDIIREVFLPEGYQVISCILPIRRSIRDLQLGKVDLYLTDWDKSYLTESPLYQPEKLHTPRTPISTELVSATVLANSPWHDQIEVKNLIPESLLRNEQHLIAWDKGFDYQRLIGLDKSSYQIVDSVKQGLNMLKAGRIKLYLNDDDNIRIVLQGRDEFKASDFRIVPLMEQQLYPVFQNNERGLKLAELYDRRMRVLLLQNRILELYRHSGYDYQPELPSE
ncbi:hypothetical protein G8770_02315 [Aestuariicella hydrocarbonica]|uniref:Amino acid ABC transporter substrate-binding protein, PAAT family n=1 Tax=Pseudomaricurvus hydrocarbonicus TaxID=1470433 RepID=A0A9E5JYE0_9GAMM|nr:hypothetical protein [Aestuariicella hydrocarbonica]NHO64382.1 hypothetical protein [Aestuariicella hydrocarbonica]